MKRILVLCSLYFITLLSYAETCPQPQDGYIFRVAAWGNHIDPTSQVRCYYYNRNDESIHYELRTAEWYTEQDIEDAWGHDDYRYHLCVSHNNNVYDCMFSHK